MGASLRSVAFLVFLGGGFVLITKGNWLWTAWTWTAPIRSLLTVYVLVCDWLLYGGSGGDPAEGTPRRPDLRRRRLAEELVVPVAPVALGKGCTQRREVVSPVRGQQPLQSAGPAGGPQRLCPAPAWCSAWGRSDTTPPCDRPCCFV